MTPITDFFPHSSLNPKIWNGDVIKPDVRKALLKIAKAFIEFLDIGPSTKVLDDIVLTGSAANYNYSDVYSDLDIHVILDFDEIDENTELVEEMIISKKSVWNLNHSITVKGINIEMYAQNIGKEEREGAGTFSLLKNKWVTIPTKENVKPDIRAAVEKAKVCIKLVKKAIKSGDLKVLDNTKEKIFNMREAGLTKEGEYSTENLAFKILRRAGYIEKFFDAKAKTLDKELSLKELYLEIMDASPSMYHYQSPTTPADIQSVDKKDNPSPYTARYNMDINKVVLIATLIGEAGGEGERGMQSVMNVIQNRGNQQKKDFSKLKAVALQTKQFSMWNSTGRKDKDIVAHVREMKQSEKWNNNVWQQAINIVLKAEKNQLPDITKGATHYHTRSVHPNWSHKKFPVAVIGTHKFYKNV